MKHTRRGHEPPDEHVKVVDATAGPPIDPPIDPATDGLTAEQHGSVDAQIYDAHSFSDGVVPLHLRRLFSRNDGREARTKIDERDDFELADDIVRAAITGGVEAVMEHDRLSGKLADAKAEQSELVAIVSAHGSSERRHEPRRVRSAWSLGVPLVSLLVEVPWSYYALLLLGEGTGPTVAIAVLFGVLGVLLAELCGIGVKKARVAGRSAQIGLFAMAGTAAAVLIVLGTFLAALRTAYLAAPHYANGVTTPSGLDTYHLDRAFVFAGWLAANLGLWLGIAALSYFHHTPGLVALQQSDATVEALECEVVSSTARVVDTVEAVKRAKLRLEHVHEKWENYREELGAGTLALASIYFDALAHAKSDPEFTTAVEHLRLRLGIERRATSDDEEADRAGGEILHLPGATEGDVGAEPKGKDQPA